jgi:hypothetical protein
MDFTTNALTDMAGLFSLEGVSASTLDVKVQKAGYYNETSLNRNTFTFINLSGRHPFQPERNNPVVFHLRRKGPGVSLITSQVRFSPDLEVSVPRNGTPIEVDLLQRKASPSGQLVMTQWKPQYMLAKEAKEWGFRMEIPGGGFVEQHDAFPFEAPTDGYNSAIEFRFERAQTNWATSLSASFYITFGSPPLYGWLTVQTGIGWGGARLQYAINPDGSRYLVHRFNKTFTE